MHSRENGNGYRVNGYRVFSPNFPVNSPLGKSGEIGRKSEENLGKSGEIWGNFGQSGKSGKIWGNWGKTLCTRLLCTRFRFPDIRVGNCDPTVQWTRPLVDYSSSPRWGGCLSPFRAASRSGHPVCTAPARSRRRATPLSGALAAKSTQHHAGQASHTHYLYPRNG